MPTTVDNRINGNRRVGIGIGGVIPNRMSKVPNISVSVDEHNIQEGANEVLKVVRPQWISKNGGNNIKYKVFTDGLSNKLVGFFVEDNKEDVVIVKVFGTNTDHMIDRQAEVETMRLLHERKCGAELYATFENGICYQYMNGVTLEVENCRDPKIFPLVAAEMARMHSDIGRNNLMMSSSTNGNGAAVVHEGVKGMINGNGSHSYKNGHYNSRHHHQESTQHKSQIWNKLRQFSKLAEGVMASDPDFKEKLQKVGVFSGWADSAISELESILESQDMPVSFCHNDLIPRNMVYDEKRGKVTFIDVEYAMYNYAPFDVANHFLEFAGVDQIDYTKYPDQQFRYRWLKEYLKHLKLDYDYPEEEITVEKYDSWVQLCVPVSHLFWGLWGIYQGRHSTIDFDYIGYVELRLSEFKKHMERLRQLPLQKRKGQ